MALDFSIRSGGLNWLYLVEVIVVVVVIIFYLFYFGRTLGWVVSVILRTYFWRKYRAWLDIGSIQFSPLGGRLLFRDLTYVGENETIKIVMGHVTWRYWLLHVRREEDLKKDDDTLPCRTTLQLEGLEWFIYNRGPAFDALLERLGHREGRPMASDAGTMKQDSASVVKILPPSDEVGPNRGQESLDWSRETLPIEVHVSRGAVVLGNRSTPSLIVAGFQTALGTCGALDSRSVYDYYKQVYQFTFSKPKIVFRKNHDYDSPMAEHGARMSKLKEQTTSKKPYRDIYVLQFRHFESFLRRFTEFAEYVFDIRPHRPQDSKVWHGLPRYQAAVETLYDETQPSVEDSQYAKVSTIYDQGHSLELTYYADTAGYVPLLSEKDKSRKATLFEKPDIGNGDLAPEWGIDLKLNGGTLTYGPWADRQRGELQKAFFPPAYFDSQPTPRLRPGDKRMHAALKIYVDFGQSTTVRVPTRESSKDWRHDGLADSTSIRDSTHRRYGWLDFCIGADSSITFVLPMVASSAGYDTMLELHIDQLCIFSSLNYQKFFETRLCRVSCQLPSPLVWDATHHWTINVNMQQPELFLLRDHTYLLTDLIRDWTSGPPVDYDHFVPFLYNVNLNISDYRLHIYLNDRNIINNFDENDENTLLSLAGPRLKVAIGLPVLSYRPPTSTLSCAIEADTVRLTMSPPSWNTHSVLETPQVREFAAVRDVRIELSHTVHAVPSPKNVELLDIEIKLIGVDLKVLGWVIKYLINVKENYFGDFSHFVTIEEYRRKHEQGNPGDPLELKYRPGKSDIFEVNLNLTATEAALILPQELHDCKSAVSLSVPELTLFLRNHDYFMDFNVTTNPIGITVLEDYERTPPHSPRVHSHGKNEMVLDGLAINAHRLFGPQPRTSVYVAIWEFALGRLTGHIDVPTVNGLMRAGRAFGMSFQDKDNAPAEHMSIQADPDITFLTLAAGTIDVTVWSSSTAINLLLSHGIRISLDDQVQDGWVSHLDAHIPRIELRALLAPDLNEGDWLEVASLTTSVSVGLGATKLKWQEEEYLQKSFLKRQDRDTGRCPFLYDGQQVVEDYFSKAATLCLPSLHAGILGNLPGNGETMYEGVPNSTGLSERRLPRSRKSSAKARAESRASSQYHSDKDGSTPPKYGNLLRRYRCTRTGGLYESMDSDTFIPTNPDDWTSMDDSAAVPGISHKRSMRHDGGTYRPRQEGEVLHRVHVSLPMGVRVTVSPKAARVGEGIIDDLEKNGDAEHGLDAIEAAYSDDFRPIPVDDGGGAIHQHPMPTDDRASQGDAALDTSGNDDGRWPEEHLPAPTARSFHATLELPSLSVNMIQDILRPGDLDMADELDDPHSGESAIICTAQLSIRNVTASLIQSFETVGSPLSTNATRPIAHTAFDAKLNVGRGRLIIRHLMASERYYNDRSSSAGLPDSPPGTVLALTSQGISARSLQTSQNAKASVEFSGTTLAFVQSAAEFVTGTVHSWFIAARKIETALVRAQHQPKATQRRFVTQILELAHREGITTDPAFMNTLTPIALPKRSDLNWKTLAHLRHCLRLLSPGARTSLQTSLLTPPKTNSDRDYQECWRFLREWLGWDAVDEGIVVQIPLIAGLFPLQAMARTPSGAAESTKLLSANIPAQMLIKTAGFEALFYEDMAMCNALIIEPCELYASYTPSDHPRTNHQCTLALRANFGAVDFKLNAAFLRLVRHVVKVRRVFEAKLAPLLPKPGVQGYENKSAASRDKLESPFLVKGLHIVMTMLSEKITINMPAEDIIAKVVFKGLRGAGTLQVQGGETETRRLHDEALKRLYIGCDSLSMSVTAESLAVAEDRTSIVSEKLVELNFMEIESDTSHHTTADGSAALAMTLVSSSSRLRVTRTLLRMSKFIEHWRTDSLPQHKIVFEEFRRDLEKDWAPSAVRPPPQASKTAPPLAFNLHVGVPIIMIHVKIAQRLWVKYAVHDALLFGTGRDLRSIEGCTVGLKAAKQTLEFTETKESIRHGNSPPFSGETITLPPFYATLTYRQQHVDALVSIERVHVTLTAIILDNVLEVQNQFEQDIDEIFSVFVDHKQRSKGQQRAQKELSNDTGLSWRMQVALRGLNLGLQGPACTQFVGADLIDGFVSQEPLQAKGSEENTHWEVSAINLALSLAQRTSETSLETQDYTERPSRFDRNYRLAYFVLDLRASSKASEVSELTALAADVEGAPQLHVRVTKVHAVMQTGAIEALDSLIDHFKEEVLNSKRRRAAEVAAIKEKVIQTFDLPEKQTSPLVRPYLERCVLALRIENFGIAVPLTDMEIEAPWFGHEASTAQRNRPAFLVSTPSFEFATAKGSAGYAVLTELSAQFIKVFDQTNESHFLGARHVTNNRIMFPSAGVRIKSDQGASQSQKAYIVEARMKGVELDLDATIFKSVFALVDLYEVSYERLARHAGEKEQIFKRPTVLVQESSGNEASFMDSTTFEATFVVDKGNIRLHNYHAQELMVNRERPSTPTSIRHGQLGRKHSLTPSTATNVRSAKAPAPAASVVKPDEFVIPKFSTWAVKRGASSPDDTGTLHLDATIHGSENKLLPSLLPFLSEASEAVKKRMQRVTETDAQSSKADEEFAATSPSAVAHDRPTTGLSTASSPSVSHMIGLTFSLRINESKLDIRCTPLSPARATLVWRSGGLIASWNPGRRTAEATLQVEQVTLQWTNEHAIMNSIPPCAVADVSNIVFASVFSPQERNKSVASFDLDLERISGDIDFTRCQDLFSFKAVWLDKLEQLVPTPTSKAVPVRPGPPSQPSTSQVITLFVGRIKQLQLVLRLPTEIGTVVLDGSHLVGRWKLVPRESRAVSIDLQTLKAAASSGRLIGTFETDGLYFETNLHDICEAGDYGCGSFMSLSAFIGQTDALFDYDQRRFLLIQTEPIRIGASDDWSAMRSDRQLRLDFSLRFGQFSVYATAQTVPTILSMVMAMETLLRLKRESARASLAESMGRLMPLKTVPPPPPPGRDSPSEKSAESSQPCMASQGIPTSIPSGTRVIGRIDLEAARLRLAVFLHDFKDMEAFRGDAGAVKAILERSVSDDGVISRDLQLHLGFFSIRKLRTKGISEGQEKAFTIAEWFNHLRIASERNIFKFPTSEAHMASEQREGTLQLSHRFSLVFTGQLDISLNYALLKQLGEVVNRHRAGIAAVRRRGRALATPSSLSVELPQQTEVPEGGREAKTPIPVPAATIPPPQPVDRVRSIEYIALESNIQQPQLQLLGDATPPLEWLGVQRGHFPAWIHEGVTTVLEQILLELTNVYRQSLARNASVNA